MQRPYGRLLVDPALGDLDQRVQMGGRPVREFVAHGRRGHTASPAQEERAAQLPFQCAYLRGDRGLGEAEQRGGPGEGPGPVHRHESTQQGQVHVLSLPPLRSVRPEQL